jgi:hypothetical protein
MVRPAESLAFSSLHSSGSFHDRTNDHLKDIDNVGWVGWLDGGVQDDWLVTLEWIRTADRVVEATVSPDPVVRDQAVLTHRAFMAGWEAVRRGEEPPDGTFAPLLSKVAARWRRDGLTEDLLRPWDVYLDALWQYRSPTHVTESEGEYRAELLALGSLFQALPQQPSGLAGAVGALGMLDQFFNNLRDLAEDAAMGMCRFPLDLLARFGMRSEEFPQLIVPVDARFVAMVEHLLATLVPEVRLEADPLFRAPGLHPSWVEMIRQVLARHGRVEAMARLCGFDAAAFEVAYWNLVGRQS